jgi:uncharacterized protein (TIGR03067 family)
LKLASDRYFYNKVGIIPDNPSKHADLLTRELTAPTTPGRGKLARCVVVADVYRAVLDQEPAERQRLIKTFPDAARATAVDTVLAGLPKGFDLSFSELRAAGGALEAHVDKLRKLEVGKWVSRVFVHQIAANSVDFVLTDYGPRFGKQDLSGMGVLQVQRTTFDLSSDYKYPGFDQWGHYVQVKNVGTTPLTNVVIVKKLKTPGASAELSPNQKGVLAINEATGFGDKNPDIELMFMAQNYHGTMPKVGFAFVPALNPGDVAKVCLYDADRELVRDGSVAVYCDQGRLPEQTVTLVEKPAGQIAPKQDPSGKPVKFAGPHVGRWEAIGYEYQGGRTTASLVWEVRDDGTIETSIPKLGERGKGGGGWKYATDDTKSPKQIDLSLTEGPLAGKILQGIYKVENDVLTVCYPKGNVRDVERVRRPTDFDVSRRSDVQILRLKRVRKTP